MRQPQSFRLVLLGGYAPGVTPAEAHARLARMTGSDPARAARLVAKAPIPVKKGLDEEQARRYLRALERTGLLCRLELEGAEGLALQDCPKCGALQLEGGLECSECGIVFSKFRPPPAAEEPAADLAADPAVDPDAAQDTPEAEPAYGPREISREGWMALGIGMAGAVFVLAVPFLNIVFSAFSTLVHEFGHSLVAWMFGYPSLPAFDFVYGGGVALHFEREIPLLWMIYGAFAWLLYLYRHRTATLMVLAVAIGLYTLFAFTSLHRLLGLFMGHGMELVFAGLFLFRALSGHATFHHPERILYGLVGFMLLFRAVQFAYDYFSDSVFRAMYLEGKGGLTNDFVRIASMLDVELDAVFSFFLLCAVLPPLLAWLAYRYEPIWWPFLRRLFARP